MWHGKTDVMPNGDLLSQNMYICMDAFIYDFLNDASSTAYLASDDRIIRVKWKWNGMKIMWDNIRLTCCRNWYKPW